MSQSVLEGEHLYRFYHIGDEETFALRGVDVSLRAGEFVAIIGPSGSGKSTLLNCLVGLDDPSGGVVTISGQRMSRRPERVRARLRAECLGIMTQAGNLFPHLSVQENIRLQQMISRKTQLPSVEQLLGDVGLEKRHTAMPATLSGGEAARAALAIALSVRPLVLICDEPTGEVDEITENAVVTSLKAAQSEGTAILVATHSLVLADRADRIIALDDGMIA